MPCLFKIWTKLFDEFFLLLFWDSCLFRSRAWTNLKERSNSNWAPGPLRFTAIFVCEGERDAGIAIILRRGEGGGLYCIFLLLNHHTYSTNLKLNRQVTWVSVGFLSWYSSRLFTVLCHLSSSMSVIVSMYLRNCHRPCLLEQAQVDLSFMLAVAIGLARVNNWPECITFFAIHEFDIGLILNSFIYLLFSLLGIICK